MSSSPAASYTASTVPGPRLFPSTTYRSNRFSCKKEDKPGFPGCPPSNFHVRLPESCSHSSSHSEAPPNHSHRRSRPPRPPPVPSSGSASSFPPPWGRHPAHLSGSPHRFAGFPDSRRQSPNAHPPPRPSAPSLSTMLLPHLHHFSSFIFMSCTCLRPFKAPPQSRAPILSLFSIRHHPDQIPQKCCFSASRRRNQKRIPDTSRPWIRQNRPYFCCTSYHLMRKTDI